MSKEHLSKPTGSSADSISYASKIQPVTKPFIESLIKPYSLKRYEDVYGINQPLKEEKKTISASVGKDGQNDREDVILVQNKLVALGLLSAEDCTQEQPEISETEEVKKPVLTKTIEAINTLQKYLFKGESFGIVKPNMQTMQALRVMNKDDLARLKGRYEEHLDMTEESTDNVKWKGGGSPSLVNKNRNAKPAESKTETMPKFPNVSYISEYSKGGKELSSTNAEVEDAGNVRVFRAKEYDRKFKYSLGREEQTTNCADFIAKVMMQTDKEIAKRFTDKNGYSNVDSILKSIDELGDKLRQNNPKVGDLVLWEGHVEFVSEVNEDKILIYGGSSGWAPKETGKNSKNQYWLNIKYLQTEKKWNGKFLGFWTPR